MDEIDQELKAELTAEPISEQPKEQPDRYEELAAKQGWEPQEAFEANPANEGKIWRPAREFVDRGELIDQIGDLKRQVSTIQTQTREQLAQERQMALKEAARIAEEKLTQAVDAGDKAGAMQAAKDLQDLKPSEPAVDPSVTSWNAQNDWFGTHPGATDYARYMDAKLYKAHGGTVDTATHLQNLQVEVFKRFPELDNTVNPNRDRSSAVQTSTTRKTTAPKQPRLADLPEAFQESCKRFVKMGVFKNADEYIKDAIEQGVINV